MASIREFPFGLSMDLMEAPQSFEAACGMVLRLQQETGLSAVEIRMDNLSGSPSQFGPGDYAAPRPLPGPLSSNCGRESGSRRRLEQSTASVMRVSGISASVKAAISSYMPTPSGGFAAKRIEAACCIAWRLVNSWIR